MTARTDAIKAGALTFNTGKPCRNGHMTDRYTSGGMCIGCLKAQQDSIKAKRAEQNTMKFEGLMPVEIYVKKQYHGAVSDYAHILRYGDAATIEQAQSFITMLKGITK